MPEARRGLRPPEDFFGDGHGDGQSVGNTPSSLWEEVGGIHVGLDGAYVPES